MGHLPVSDAQSLVECAWRRGMAPPPDLTVSEWADRYRQLGSSVSSEPGAWRTDRVPYMRQVMDCLSPSSPARIIAFMKGSQVAGTEASLNWVGHTVYFGLGSMLIVLPSQDTAKEWSRQRLSQLCDDTEALHGKIADAKRRDSGNTSFAKKFPGGFLKIAWSSSAKKLRSTPAGLLLADEVDGFGGDSDGEGDPIALLKRRFTNYPRGKLFLVSTPKLRGTSRIEREFENGDQRYYFLPCPHCDWFQQLAFSQLRWDKHRPESVAYVCTACQEQIFERHKTQMLLSGVWMATRDCSEITKAGFHRSDLSGVLRPITEQMMRATEVSFHLSALYSPLGWYSWYAAAKEWEEAQGNAELLKVYVNTVLGETWVDRGEAPDYQILLDRRESYVPGTVPKGALFLTAGADVQRDRIEVEIVGWGRNRESWSIDYRILEGRTTERDVWNKLSGVLSEVFPHESGASLPISRAFVDSGDGTTTNDVYAWARTQDPERICAIKGDDRGILPVSQPSPVDVTVDGRKHREGLKIKTVKVSFFKSELYAALRLRPPTGEEKAQGWTYPPGYCHFPEGKNYGDEHFLQLTAEQLVTRRLNTGKTRLEWQKTRDRNESLDCRIYARAAAWDYGFDQAQEAHWRGLETQLEIKKREAEKPVEKQRAADEWRRADRDSGGWIPRRKGWLS